MLLYPIARFIAGFIEDKTVYRAVVEGVEGKKVLVRFIDYGNSEMRR